MIEAVRRMPTPARWRWRVDAPVPGADPRQRATEDAPARVLVAFTGDRVRRRPAAAAR